MMMAWRRPEGRQEAREEIHRIDSFIQKKKQKKINDHQVLPYCVQVY